MVLLSTPRMMRVLWLWCATVCRAGLLYMAQPLFALAYTPSLPLPPSAFAAWNFPLLSECRSGPSQHTCPPAERTLHAQAV